MIFETQNPKRKTRNPRGRQQMPIRIALLAALTAGGAAFGQLPGLPAPQAPVSEGVGDPRSGPGKVMVVTQTGPLRGSLFKQGAAAASANSGAATGQADSPVQIPSHPTSFIAVQPGQGRRRYRKNDILSVIIHEDSNPVIQRGGQIAKGLRISTWPWNSSCRWG